MNSLYILVKIQQIVSTLLHFWNLTLIQLIYTYTLMPQEMAQLQLCSKF